jgi:azurin
MYQYLLVSLAIAAAPMLSPALQTPAPTQKPAATAKPDTAKPAAQGGARTIEIVATEDMKYSVPTIEAKRGEQIRIRLVGKGTMPKIAMAHNFVLLGLKADVTKFVTAGMNARATDFIPAEMKDQVIASTALAGAGETVEVTFKVPAAAGAYPFICSFPGHFQAGMKGTLNVK